MQITLRDEQTQIQRGIYANPEQAIEMALKLLEAQSLEHEQWANEVRLKVNEAAEELARGEGIPLETVAGQLEEKFCQAREPQA